jgi:hypothetical protein
VAQRVGRGIALLFHDRGTRRGWVVSSTPRPHFTTGKYPVPILQEAGWVLGPVWTGGKSRPHRDSVPGRPARSQSLYRLSYPAHKPVLKWLKKEKEQDGKTWPWWMWFGVGSCVKLLSVPYGIRSFCEARIICWLIEQLSAAQGLLQKMSIHDLELASKPVAEFFKTSNWETVSENFRTIPTFNHSGP